MTVLGERDTNIGDGVDKRVDAPREGIQPAVHSTSEALEASVEAVDPNS
ncbi:MAG TPA: hypothetical protein VMR97_00670 [Acidimicrobiales bacterium]|nr:hypothetical protein [Acidimicrobiales bacterium]